MIQPLVTFAMLAYNQEKFIRESVLGAINQEYENLEIIFSDDCSTDSTFEIIKSIVSGYSGKHKISINKNPVNIGLACHFNSIVSRSQGAIIVIAAGDDVSLPTRTRRTVEIFNTDPSVSIVSFTDNVIDENGNMIKEVEATSVVKLKKITLKDYLEGNVKALSGASRGFKKNIFDTFGELNPECPTEDTPYILRGLMIGNALISTESGINYRRHENNLSGAASLHSMNIENIKEQYIKDVATAHSKNLINKQDNYKINKWIERNYRRRLLAKNYWFAKNKKQYLFSEIIFNNSISLREKIVTMINAYR